MLRIQAGYSAGQAARAVGLTYRKVDHWARTGLVEPSIVVADGSGTAREYSFDDLVALRAAKRLREGGISVQSIRKAVELIRSMTSSRQPLRDRYLIPRDKDVVEVDGNTVRSWLKHPGQQMFLWILDVDAVKKDVELNIKNVQRPARGPASRVG